MIDLPQIILTTNNFILKIRYVLLLLAIALKVNTAFSQSKSSQVLGHGFDIRFVDALNWENSSKGTRLVNAQQKNTSINSPTDISYHFVTNPYEFEKELLLTNTTTRPYLAKNTNAHYKALKNDGTDKLLFVYSYKKEPQETLYFSSNGRRTLDSAFVEDFRRLGRDITPAGFINRYGTHYAREVTQGGLFLKRNSIQVSDFIYSPYNKEEFQKKVVEDIISNHTGNLDTTPFIDSKTSLNYTQGGEQTATWIDSWTTTVNKNKKPIDVTLETISSLLKNTKIENIQDKEIKLKLLDSLIDVATTSAREQIQQPRESLYYKKYSLQFEQEVTSIVKTSMGRDNEDKTSFTGDIFFGGFSKDEAILQTKPLIERGGLRLETLITDEKVVLNRNVLITIKPEDISDGYVSVWDDTKKLFKGNGRTTLRVSGPKEAHAQYQDALRQVITKNVRIETIDKDVYDIEYTLRLVKQAELITNSQTTYNYVLDSEILAAASTGNKSRLDSLFVQNGNPRTAGLVETIIINKHPNTLLNYVLDQGAQATTQDLDLLFERTNFDIHKALILLERGAKPKNNMIYKAVAYKAADVIYALFREGATSQNNDLAFALERSHYPTIKALMSEEYEAFEAGKNELLLAAENNDPVLAQKFIDLGATADAYILEIAAAQSDNKIKDVIIPVTETSSATLEVVANLDDTKLFEYFVNKNAQLDNNKAVEAATDNNNLDILDLALKNGGKSTEALNYAIKKENKPAIEVSLQNKANPDAVFAYAAEKGDEQLFNNVLDIYDGTPSVALNEAVKKDALPLARAVIKSKPQDINPTETIDIAVSNENLEMVKLLVSNNADPNTGVSRAVELESVPITSYLIAQGARTINPIFLQSAVKKENLELSKLLIEKGGSKADNAIVEASNTGNVKITKYLLEKGATANEAFKSAMETKNEDVILLLMEEITSFTNSHLITASRKGNLKVVQRLLDEGLNPTTALSNALSYKNTEILKLLLDQGAIPSSDLLRTAVSFNYYDGIQLLLNTEYLDGNTQFENGEYPIHVLSNSFEELDRKILELLLKNNASMNAQNANGETALHLAAIVQEKDIDLVKLLLEKGASISIKDNKGATPLNYALDKSIKTLLRKATKQQTKKR